MKKLTILLLLCMFYGAGKAQISVEGTAAAGMLLEHHGNMSILARERPYAFSLGLARQTDRQSWASFYNFPRYGVSLIYLSPGDPEDIGQIYAVMSYIHFSFLKQNHYWLTPGMRAGVGIGYVTKPYDANTNYRNTVLSTHWNVGLSLDFDLEARVYKGFYLRPGIGLLHFSNGATRVPNYGINLLMASITARYVFGQTEENCFLFKAPEEKNFFAPTKKRDRRTHLDLFLTGGVKENRFLFDAEKYGAGVFSVQGSYRYASQAAVGVAANVFYDSSEYKEILHNNAGASLERWQITKPGFGLNHEFFFGRLSFFAEGGVYVHLHKYSTQLTYQRFALRYAAGNLLRLHLGVKTYYYSGLAADWIEFGLGFRVL